jgi:hypothetical protein
MWPAQELQVPSAPPLFPVVLLHLKVAVAVVQMLLLQPQAV